MPYSIITRIECGATRVEREQLPGVYATLSKTLTPDLASVSTEG